MIVFDSSFLIALLNKRDRHYHSALRFLDDMATFDYGSRVTIDYVLDEVLTRIWSSTLDRNLVKQAYDLICATPEFLRCYRVEVEILQQAWDTWLKIASPNRPLSFTDACILAFAKREENENNTMVYIATFDNDFRGIAATVP
ncbi:MAG: type II toxin-antitoxin system VapC family toxin [Candidatus Thorarchaeota archaeon]